MRPPHRCASKARVARYYDPQTAQFLTRDPIESITQQPYQYAFGDPLDNDDPLGLCCSLHGVLHVVQTASAVVQAGADLVATGAAAVGAEPIAAGALAVSEAAGTVNTAATCLDAVTGGPSSLGDCAVSAATNIGTAGFAKYVTPGRVVRDRVVYTAEDRLYQGSANLFGDLFGWAYQYKLKYGADGQCSVQPSFGPAP